MTNGELQIIPFARRWQDAARALVLAGMAEHWGQIDLAMNPDLDNIAEHYRNGHFLLAVSDGRPIGTGAVLPEGAEAMRIVRMSVARESRRRGVATHVLKRLLALAADTGCRRVLCETTETWDDAIHFYLDNGFAIAERRNGEVHFVLALRGRPGRA